MVSAQVFGLVRFVLEFIYPEPGCGEEDNRISFLKVRDNLVTSPSLASCCRAQQTRLSAEETAEFLYLLYLIIVCPLPCRI